MSFSEFRLTAESGHPLMQNDHPIITQLFYTPFTGNIAFGQTLPELTFILDGNPAHTQYIAGGSIYDLYLFTLGASWLIGNSPAWPSINQQNMLPPWASDSPSGETNTIALQLRYGTAADALYTAPAGAAFYIGTLFATANGQTSFVRMPKPVANGTGLGGYFLGFWNAYNRRTITGSYSDGRVGWNYSAPDTTARPAGNNYDSRVFWVAGRYAEQVTCRYDSSLGSIPGNVPAGGTVGCVMNWAPGENYIPHSNYVSQSGYSDNAGIPVMSSATVPGQIGINNFTPIEYSTPVPTNYFGTQFNGNGWLSFSTLTFTAEM